MKKTILLSVCAVLVLSVVGCNYISEKMSEDLKTISTQELAQGIANKTLLVFDNNSPKVYQKNHIPTAVHLDPRSPDASLLPPDKNAKLIFYCKNEWCMSSHVGARFAIEQGYGESYVYSQGIDGWIEAGQPTQSASPPPAKL